MCSGIAWLKLIREEVINLAKSKTASYTLTLELKTEKFQEDILNKRFEKCRTEERHAICHVKRVQYSGDIKG